MPDEEIRWHYRFRNFSRAFRRLQDALQIEEHYLDRLHELHVRLSLEMAEQDTDEQEAEEP